MFKRFARRFYSANPTSKQNDTLKVGLFLTGSILGTSIAFNYFTDSRAGFYSGVLMPLLHQFDPEDTHRWSIWFARVGIVPYEKEPINDPKLEVELWGKRINNPVGLAAGYDKHGEAIDAMLGFGFGTVEIGSVTPQPQKGNPLPRMFRLSEDEAVINRYGFNSHGHGTVINRLKSRIRRYMNARAIEKVEEVKLPNSLVSGRLLGVNLGKNKTSDPNSHEDYVNGVIRFAPLADYLVINISSPNTPGLRALQRREPIEQLLRATKAARDLHAPKTLPPLLVKIAPDCSDTELEDIAAVVKSVGIDGVIISNTTISRPTTLKSGSYLLM
jgi:dihydroorotate dehydrogenase